MGRSRGSLGPIRSVFTVRFLDVVGNVGFLRLSRRVTRAERRQGGGPDRLRRTGW